MKSVISKEDINKLNSTEGIVSLLCDIPDFTFDKIDDLDEDTRYLVEDTLRIQLLTPSQIDRNLRRSLEANNLALLNIRRSTALALYYFGNKDENGHYISYTCPYTGKVFNLNEIEREIRKPYNQRDKNKILELEHIIPHSSNGGTVLFNVLPASREANSRSEKSNLHLLDWYSQSGNKYYNSENLHDIVSFILTAYSVSLQDFEESEWDEYGIESEELLEDNESLDNPLAEKKRNKNKQLTEIEGYYPFLKSLINKLDQEGYDVSLFNQELRNLEEKNIFKDIEKLDIIQETVERIISNYLNDQSNSYLTYSLNINYLKLLESISANTKEEIEQELEKRFNHIKSIMDDNDKPIIDYFISLRDLEDKDILYKEKPTEKELEIFINNIKVSYYTKIEIFIDMLSEEKYTSYKGGYPDSNNIFGMRNKVPYKGYEHIEGLTTSAFWSNNNPEIESRLEEKLKTLEERETLSEKELENLQKLKKAAKAIADYEFTNRLNLAPKIEVFIDMLSEDKYTSYKGGEPDSNNIFKATNKVPYKGYEHIEGLTTKYFWSTNNPKIEARLEEKIRALEERSTLSEKEVEEVQKLKKAAKAIADYKFQNQNGLSQRIEVFIDMLSEDKYTSYKGGQPDPNNIFKSTNEVPYKGYEHIEGLTTGQFWMSHNPEIEARLEEKIRALEERETLSEKEVEELQKLKKAAKAIADYEFSNKHNLAPKIEVFIDMLSNDKYTSYKGGDPDSNNIFKDKNKVPYKGYEHIEGLTIGQFWKSNNPKIEARLEEKIRALEEKKTLSEKELEELQKLKKAAKAIADYEFTNIQNLAPKIEAFIDMLSEDKYTSYRGGDPDSNNIFSNLNKVPYKGYEHIEGLTTSWFWKSNNPKIEARLEEKIRVLEERETLSEKEAEELQKLKKAAKAIADYKFEKKDGLSQRIEVFIDMLSEDKYTSYKGGKPDSNNIFSQYNEVSYKGYEHIEGLTIGPFWNSNKEKQIIPRLFYNRCYDSEKKEYVVSDKDYSGKEYDKARSSILKYLKVNSIEEYIKKLQKKKTKTKKIKDLIDLVELCHKANEEIAKEEAKLREEIKEDKRQLEEKMGGIAI